MKNNIGKVVGIKRGISKEKGRPWTVLYLLGDFGDYEENVEGHCCKEIFVYGYCDVKLNEEVEIKYSVGFQGRAVVSGIAVIENA